MSNLDFSGGPSAPSGGGGGALNFGGGGTNLNFGGGVSTPSWARPPASKGFFTSHVPLIGHAIDATLMEGGRFATDLENQAIGAVTGTYQLAHDALVPGYHPSWGELGHEWGQFLRNPLTVFSAESQTHDALNRDMTAMYHQTVKSLRPHEILVHPGNAFMTMLLLGGFGGGVVGRGGLVGRI